MFGPGLGAPELLLVVVIILLIFGAGKLTDIGSSFGQAIREFRHAVRDDGTDANTTPDSFKKPE